MPRAKLLSVQEGSQVLLRYSEALLKEQDGKDLRGLLFAGLVRPHHLVV
jgi:hypothetical protein